MTSRRPPPLSVSRHASAANFSRTARTSASRPTRCMSGRGHRARRGVACCRGSCRISSDARLSIASATVAHPLSRGSHSVTGFPSGGRTWSFAKGAPFQYTGRSRMGTTLAFPARCRASAACSSTPQQYSDWTKLLLISSRTRFALASLSSISSVQLPPGRMLRSLQS